MNIPIDRQAPVMAVDSIEINASVERVWQLLTEIDKWPNWQKDINFSSLKAEKPVVNAAFHWKSGGLSFQSTIHTAAPMSEFGWTGKTIGARAIHNWQFEDRQGHTFVKVEESLDGFFPKLFRKKFSESLAKGMKKSLQELKLAAELQ